MKYKIELNGNYYLRYIKRFVPFSVHNRTLWPMCTYRAEIQQGCGSADVFAIRPRLFHENPQGKCSEVSIEKS